MSLSDGFKRVIDRMHADKFSRAVKRDEVILKVGLQLFDKHGGEKRIIEDDKIEYINGKMRELARLAVVLQQDNILKLQDCIKPHCFDTVVRAVRTVANFDYSSSTYGTPSLALKLDHSLNKCCNIIKSEALRNRLTEQYEDAKHFEELLRSDWAVEVSSRALATLSDRKMNKERQIPLTEDITKLHSKLDQEIERCRTEIKVKVSAALWSVFAQVMLAKVLTFNRRRSGEMGRLLLTTLNGAQLSYRSDDIGESLSPIEKKLCNELYRLEIRGKRGRSVPVLLTKDMEDSLDLLTSKRLEGGVRRQPVCFCCDGNKDLAASSWQ